MLYYALDKIFLLYTEGGCAVDVKIRIVGTQAFDGQSDTVTQTVVGTLALQGDTAQLCYTEQDDDGANTAVTVTATADGVTVERRGAFSSRLQMRPRVRCQSDYGTPYGTFEVTTLTHAFRRRVDEESGEIFLAYTLTLGGQAMENTLHITIERTHLS